MSVPHTLGPWRPADGCVYGDPDKDGWTAVALTPCPASPPHSARRRQWAVDARLIAAAPELLELMHWAITAVDRLAEVTPSGLLRTGIQAKADEIRAAIAKATGQ